MKHQISRAGSLAEGCPAAWPKARGAYASRAGDPGFESRPVHHPCFFYGVFDADLWW